MMCHRYDVNASLKDCDRLAGDWDERSCYSGVFMEHNMGASMQAFGVGMFGMHRHSMPAANVVLFKPNDLHYPCDATPARYRRECYEGAVRHLAYAPSELPRGVAFCKSLPEGESRSRCWDGVGLQVGGFFSDSASRQRACQSDVIRDVAACVEGAGVTQSLPARNRP